MKDWMWTVVRGIIALALGLFLIFGGETARTASAYAAAIYLTIAGAMQTFSGVFNRHTPGSRTDRLRGLLGLIAGVALLLVIYFGWLPLSSVFLVVAIAVILFGVLGLFESFFDRGAKMFTWLPVLINVLLVIWGVLIFYSRSNATFDLKLWTGVILAIIGVGAIAYGYVVQKGKPAVLAANA